MTRRRIATTTAGLIVATLLAISTITAINANNRADDLAAKLAKAQQTNTAQNTALQAIATKINGIDRRVGGGFGSSFDDLSSRVDNLEDDVSTLQDNVCTAAARNFSMLQLKIDAFYPYLIRC